MDIAAAIGVVSVLGLTIGWFVRLERRFGGTMTHREHSKICELQQRELADTLKQINDKLEEQNRSAANHRERVTGQLHDIALDMAVVQTRLGNTRRRKIAAGA